MLTYHLTTKLGGRYLEYLLRALRYLLGTFNVYQVTERVYT